MLVECDTTRTRAVVLRDRPGTRRRVVARPVIDDDDLEVVGSPPADAASALPMTRSTFSSSLWQGKNTLIDVHDPVVPEACRKSDPHSETGWARIDVPRAFVPR